ncbi:MAG TPA: MBL fold metallo-hydrolase [Gaiellaceae bacterium]|nr:MBL fold metallo-hydrolase [Gaiellaceae bacterium]
MIVERSMDPTWLSNAYLVADRAGGTAVFVDSGAPIEPLMSAVQRLEVQVTHLLTTHAHSDHIAHHEELERRFGTTVVADPAEDVAGAEPVGHGEIIETGDLRIEALRTPGHSPGMLAFDVNGEVCFTGDTLFAGSVGGTRDAFEDLRRSVMDVLMGLPPDMKVYPGHTEETTIGWEWENNPFVRVWRGVEPEGEERVYVAGAEATLIAWSADYDGNGKGWVRFADGRNAIIGGSRIERSR